MYGQGRSDHLPRVILQDPHVLQLNRVDRGEAEDEAVRLHHRPALPHPARAKQVAQHEVEHVSTSVMPHQTEALVGAQLEVHVAFEVERCSVQHHALVDHEAAQATHVGDSKEALRQEATEVGGDVADVRLLSSGLRVKGRAAEDEAAFRAVGGPLQQVIGADNG